MEETKSIKQEAQAYEPPQTLNIADLGRFPIDMPLHQGEGKDSKGEVFKYKYIIVDGKNYRIPNVVLGNIKTLLEEMPDLKLVRVIKEGTGIQTRYTVIPVTETEQIKG